MPILLISTIFINFLTFGFLKALIRHICRVKFEMSYKFNIKKLFIAFTIFSIATISCPCGITGHLYCDHNDHFVFRERENIRQYRLNIERKIDSKYSISLRPEKAR